METYEDLEKKVIAWANARQIIRNGTANSQLLKAVSEMGELADAHAKSNVVEIRDALGDIIVCLINYCAIQKLDLTECLAGAYDQIKDRRGYLTPEGTFVKEA